MKNQHFKNVREKKLANKDIKITKREKKKKLKKYTLNRLTRNKPAYLMKAEKLPENRK
jgi:hypothetical protein